MSQLYENKNELGASSSADELPPLPKPKAPATEYFSDEPVYSVEEVRAILAADRIARQGEPVAGPIMANGMPDKLLRYSIDCDGLPFVDSDGVWIAYSDFAAIQAAAPADAPKRKYYYRMDGCNAPNSHSPDCICWHDEGTGPLAKEPDLIRSWREPSEDAREHQPDERAAFEVWAVRIGIAYHDKQRGLCFYDANLGHGSWVGWQGRATGTDRAQAGEDA